MSFDTSPFLSSVPAYQESVSPWVFGPLGGESSVEPENWENGSVWCFPELRIIISRPSQLSVSQTSGVSDRGLISA